MPSLKGDPAGFCFNHSPHSAERRAAARRHGGHAKAIAAAERKARASTAAPAEAPSGRGLRLAEEFVLGELRDVDAIADATRRLADAVACGTVPVGKGRLLREILRDAHVAVLDATGGVRATDGREPSDAELDYIVRHHGVAPPGVTILAGPFRVEGAEWKPSAEDLPEIQPSPAPAAAKVLVFPGHEAPPGF